MFWTKFAARLLGTEPNDLGACAVPTGPTRAGLGETVAAPRRRHGLVLAGLPLLALTLASCDEKPSGAAAQSNGPPPTPVTVVALQPQAVPLSTELPGRIVAAQVAEVRPQVGGILRERLFTEGQRVDAGQALYQIDPATYRATLQSAEASLQRAEATAAAARTTVNRYRPLVRARAVSQQDLDTANASLQQAEADVASAQASITMARLNVTYTKVAAPIAGRIGRSSVTTGALVTADQTTALSTVTQLDPIFVDVTQTSATLLRLRREMTGGRLQEAEGDSAEVRLTLPDGTVYARPGRMRFSEVVVDPGTGSVTLRAEFPNPDGLLLPGMFVQARVQEGIVQNAMLVPQQAVSRTPRGEATVMVATADGKLEARKIEAGRAVGTSWLVTDGLQPGERVVVEGARLRPGATVSITETTMQALEHPQPAPQQPLAQRRAEAG